MRLIGSFILLAVVFAAAADPLPGIAEHTSGMQHHPGFFDVYWDADGGRVLVRLERLDQPVIQVTALVAGLGSNDIGLDRGQLGQARLVRFDRVGRKMALVQPNTDYRADSDNPDEVRAVREAFAESVLAVLPIVAQDAQAWLVDYTDYLLTDVHGVGARLAATEQGNYAVDARRSLPLPDRVRSFPENTLVEALITYRGDKPGAEVSSVTPDPATVSLRMQHQFVVLPEPGFERRAYHPRSGYFPFRYRDYAAPLGAPIDRRLLVRHRLQLDPSGQVVEPLVYYVDRGAPEPVRSALVEGAGWWAQAFEAAGLPGAYRVELLPEGVDPLDVRYNVIQWVHRSTRGWSYGASVRDPRSGEIIKGHISLGSLRVRQDMLIAEGLLAPFETGGENADHVQAMALARLRQLSAHEVGHTLGLAHNFAASVADDASVMDYPHPFARLNQDGQIELDRAYDRGIGEWDKLAIAYGYRVFDSPAEQAAGLSAILAEAERRGLMFISDPDARGFGSVHAVAHLWDNGADPLQRFDELLKIRRAALDGFGTRVLRQGEPYSEMERKLVPIYLVHRYQAEAVSKLAGGLDYDHRQRGDGNGQVVPVAADRQRAALDALVDALSPGQLRLAPGLVEQLQPPAYGFDRDREAFGHRTGRAFDAWAPARALAQLISQMLLEPGRATRLEQHHAQNERSPGLDLLLATLSRERILSAMKSRSPDPLAVSVAWVVLREMQRLAIDPAAGDPIRGKVRAALLDLQLGLGRRGEAADMAREIERFLDKPETTVLPPRETVPPGSPI